MRLIILIIFMFMGLSGCGQSGKLYLPDTNLTPIDASITRGEAPRQ